jgi:hypothetical protein
MHMFGMFQEVFSIFEYGTTTTASIFFSKQFDDISISNFYLRFPYNDIDDRKYYFIFFNFI